MLKGVQRTHASSMSSTRTSHSPSERRSSSRTPSHEPESTTRPGAGVMGMQPRPPATEPTAGSATSGCCEATAEAGTVT